MTLDETTDRNPFPLGRLVNHDPRSRNFPAPRKAVRRPVTWRRYGKVLDQGSLGSCTGNAAAHAMNHKPYHVTGRRLLNQNAAVNIYSQASAIDPFAGAYPPEDTGSDGLSVAKVLRQMGLIQSFGHCFGIEHARDTLQYGPLLVGTVWKSEMFYPDEQGFVQPEGYDAGGHEYLLVGDNQKNRLTFLNSWSDQWGIRGKFHMTYGVFDQLLKDYGDVVYLKVTS